MRIVIQDLALRTRIRIAPQSNGHNQITRTMRRSRPHGTITLIVHHALGRRMIVRTVPRSHRNGRIMRIAPRSLAQITKRVIVVPSLLLGKMMIVAPQNLVHRTKTAIGVLSPHLGRMIVRTVPLSLLNGRIMRIAPLSLGQITKRVIVVPSLLLGKMIAQKEVLSRGFPEMTRTVVLSHLHGKRVGNARPKPPLQVRSQRAGCNISIGEMTRSVVQNLARREQALTVVLSHPLGRMK